MLKTDFKDDVFAGVRKYRTINNSDETVSFIDVTEYTQEGDSFGAKELNAITQAVNGKVNTEKGKVLSENDYSSTEKAKVAGAIKAITASGKTVTFTKNDGTTGTFQTQDTTYTHPSSGVSAGTYRSVTVNAQGHVTAGSNPTVTIAQGGTGATTAAAARTNLGAAGKSIVASVTLSASSWSGTAAPYSYTVSVTNATASSNVEVIPAASLTEAQYNAMSEACIIGGAQTAGKITLVAWGKKPTINLPIRVILRGD